MGFFDALSDEGGLNFLEEPSKKEKKSAPNKSNGQSKAAFGSAFGAGGLDEDDDDDIFKEFAVDDLDDVPGTSNPPTNEETLNLSAISADCDSKGLLDSSSLNESSDAKSAGRDKPQVTSGKTPEKESEVTFAFTDTRTHSEADERERNEAAAATNSGGSEPVVPLSVEANLKPAPESLNRTANAEPGAKDLKGTCSWTEHEPPKTTYNDSAAKSTVCGDHSMKQFEAQQAPNKTDEVLRKVGNCDSFHEAETMDVMDPADTGRLEKVSVSPEAMDAIMNVSKGKASNEPPPPQLPPPERRKIKLPQTSSPGERYSKLDVEAGRLQYLKPSVTPDPIPPTPSSSIFATKDTSSSPASTQGSPKIQIRDEPPQYPAIPKTSTVVLPISSKSNVASPLSGPCQDDANFPARPGHVNTMRGAEVGSMGPILLGESSPGVETPSVPPKHDTARAVCTTDLAEQAPLPETPMQPCDISLQPKAAERLCITPERPAAVIHTGAQESSSLENHDAEMKDTCNDNATNWSVGPPAPTKALTSSNPAKTPPSTGAPPNLLSSLSRGDKEPPKAPPRSVVIKNPTVTKHFPTALPQNTPKGQTTKPVASLLGNLHTFRAAASTLQKHPGLNYRPKSQIDGQTTTLIRSRLVPNKALLPPSRAQHHVEGPPCALPPLSGNPTKIIVPPSPQTQGPAMGADIMSAACVPTPLENQGLPQNLQRDGCSSEGGVEETHKSGASGQCKESTNGLVVDGGQVEATMDPPQKACVRPGTLAVHFMGTVRSLEMMMLEVQDLQEHVMELRVRAAIGGNRLARLDSPMLDEKLRKLKRKAHEALGIDDQRTRDAAASNA